VHTLELTIAKNENGEHRVIFSGGSNDLIPPASHSERIEWLKNSFDSFCRQIQEIESIKKQSL